MTSGFTFGAPTAQKSPFGAPSTGLTFGAPAQPTPGTGLTFGSFGAPSGQNTTGLSFGAPATTQPGLSFASPVSTAQPGLTFGSIATSTPQTGLSFGTPTTSAHSGLPSFGATPFGQSGLTFGTPTATTAQTGLSFGTPVATVTPIGAFGAPATTATVQPTLGGFGSTGLSFGAPVTSSAAPTLGGFGTTATTTTGTGFSLGTFGAATSVPGSSFGTPTATTGFQGLATTTASKPLGLFGSLTPATTSSGLGFSLSIPAPTTTQVSTGFSLGGTNSGGLFGSKNFPLTSGTNLLGTVAPASTTTTTSSSSLGLGGVDPTQSKTGATGSLPGRTESKAVKENQVPNEIVQTVESFKSFVKSQKNLSSDITHGSSKPLYKVQEDTELLKQLLATISSGLQRNAALAVRLKGDTAMCLQNAEMAQRIQDSPSGTQYDNSSLQYFQDLVVSFEHEMQVIRQEIENTEKHMESMISTTPLTSQELALAMKRLHDSFVALAGRLQSVHNSVESQKEQYLNLRKYFLKDNTNIFEEEAKKIAQKSSLRPKTTVKVAAGPTPFSALDSHHGFGMIPSSSVSNPNSTGNPLGWSSVQQSQQLPLYQQSQFSTSNLSGSLLSGGGSVSNTLNPLASPQPVENQGFQLQKPPLGNKRGKR